MDMEGAPLVDYLPERATVTSEVYVKTLKKLNYHMQRAQQRDKSELLLLCDNAQLHTNLHTTEAIP